MPSPTWIFRHATLDDVEHLHALETQCFNDQAWSLGTFRGLFSHEKNLVFCGSGAYVVAAKIGTQAEIERLGVAPHARRQGQGEAILIEALAHLEKLGARRCFLEVRADNRAARALYEKCGFAQTGVRRGYYEDGEDAILMEKLFV